MFFMRMDKLNVLWYHITKDPEGISGAVELNENGGVWMDKKFE